MFVTYQCRFAGLNALFISVPGYVRNTPLGVARYLHTHGTYALYQNIIWFKLAISSIWILASNKLITGRKGHPFHKESVQKARLSKVKGVDLYRA